MGGDAGTRDAAVLDSATDGPLSDAPSSDAPPTDAPRTRPVQTIVILLVIDDSPAMEEPQARMLEALDPFLQQVASDDVERSVHVGVVTSDMGVGDTMIGTCDEWGRDGALQSRSGCRNSFAVIDRDTEDVSAEALCLANVGSEGCGFEQPLESMLKALTPSNAATRFWGSTVGRADRENAGFLRDDALLVVVLLTNEDDCSAHDREMYVRDSTTYTNPDLNLRCWDYESALYDHSRYEKALRALRPPGTFILASIVGVPVDLAPARGQAPDYAPLIGAAADPRMVPRQDPAMPSLLDSVCLSDDEWATPAVRILDTMADLEARGVPTVLGSICAGDYQDTFATLWQRIEQARH